MSVFKSILKWTTILIGSVVIVILFIGIVGNQNSTTTSKNNSSDQSTTSTLAAEVSILGNWKCTTTNPKGSTSHDNYNFEINDTLEIIGENGDVHRGTIKQDKDKLKYKVTYMSSMIKAGMSPNVRDINILVEYTIKKLNNRTLNMDSSFRGSIRSVSCDN